MMLVHIFPGQKNDPTFPRDQYNNDGMPEYTLTPDRLVLMIITVTIIINYHWPRFHSFPLHLRPHPLHSLHHLPHNLYHIPELFRLNQLRQQKLYPFDDKVLQLAVLVDTLLSWTNSMLNNSDHPFGNKVFELFGEKNSPGIPPNWDIIWYHLSGVLRFCFLQKSKSNLNNKAKQL